MHWNPFINRLMLVDNKQSQNDKELKQKSRLHIVLTIILILGAFHKYKYFPNQESLVDKLQFALALSAMLWAVFSINSCHKNAGVICGYINSLLSFCYRYKRHGKMKKSFPLITTLNIACAYGTYFGCGHFLPFGFVFGLHSGNPCKAGFLFYWILPECKAGAHQHLSTYFLPFLAKVVVLLINYWMWMFAMTAAAFITPVILVFCCMTVKECLET